jgi:hypothetical protein
MVVAWHGGKNVSENFCFKNLEKKERGAGTALLSFEIWINNQ